MIATGAAPKIGARRWGKARSERWDQGVGKIRENWTDDIKYIKE